MTNLMVDPIKRSDVLLYGFKEFKKVFNPEQISYLNKYDWINKNNDVETSWNLIWYILDNALLRLQNGEGYLDSCLEDYEYNVENGVHYMLSDIFNIYIEADDLKKPLYDMFNYAKENHLRVPTSDSDNLDYIYSYGELKNNKLYHHIDNFLHL